ncbi:MAG: SpoIIE family protein phosphatase [Gammaproteobacteria bacterium]|nr:SpoIIE family protein phosphatase [Gammaproteobacteria bacterium]
MNNALKILTIEDELSIRMSIVAYLEDQGFLMEEADNGLLGIERFREVKPDLVLCDLRLPEMDGLDVLSHIVLESPETPVIIVSGANQMSDAIQALQRGAWDYISKPISDMAILRNSIRRALERAQLMRENREYSDSLEILNRELSQVVDQLQEDEEAARALQIQMLPPESVEFGPYQFKHRLYPSMYLSGDFIDYFRISEREIGFYIADVSGHGAASAFVTVMLKSLFERYRENLQSEGEETVRKPELMLDRLNNDLCQLKIDKFITIFYGVLNTDTNCMTYSSGGHFPYPVLVSNEGVFSVTDHDKPIGLFPDAIYTSHMCNLPVEFQLFMVSDGMLELFPKKAVHNRMEQLLSEISEPEMTLERLIEKYNVEGRGALPDDIALLTFSRAE